MDAERRAVLERVMAGLAAGDEAMVVALFERFGGEVRATVASAARRDGWTVDARDVDEVVFEACEAVAAAAGGWRPDGGALPWVFARKRIEAIVRRRRAERRRVAFDEAIHGHLAPPRAWAGDERPPLDVLGALGTEHQRCALVIALLDEVVPARDQEVLLAYALQQDAGDPSPASTVGAALAMSPSAVRKAVSRGRARLRSAVGDDRRWAPLAGMALLGPTDARRAATAA